MACIEESQMEEFWEVGYFLTEVVFDANELEPMSEEMDRVYDEHVAKVVADGVDRQASAAARGRRSFGQFHTLSTVAAEFVRKPIYLSVCQRLIGADADLYYNQATTKMPQGIGKEFDWHQDSGYVQTDPLAYITCWTAISDADLENGCIWVIPGSHRWGLQDHVREAETATQYGGKNARFPDASGAIPVPMKAGQVAVFSSLTLHRSGPNNSVDRPRRGYVPQYHVPDAINLETGMPWGDLIPVLRAGRPV